VHHHGHCRHEGWHGAGRRGFGGPPGMGPGRGPGRGGPGFGGPFRGGRMIGDGELRLVVLALLAEQPRHGYDIIKALEERSHAAYSPSPGVVYPTLTYLDEAGYVAASAEGNKKVYAISDTGRAHLEANRETADGILAALEQAGARMAKARAWFYREGDGGGSDIPGVVAAVNEARRALKAAIADRLDAPKETQEEIAVILREAAEAIRALAASGDREG